MSKPKRIDRALTWSYGGGTQSVAIAVLVAQGTNPKRPCGHTKIADCSACTARLAEALAWCVAHPAPRAGGLQPVGRIMQEQVERFEEAMCPN
jgi:hypothetical protein